VKEEMNTEEMNEIDKLGLEAAAKEMTADMEKLEKEMNEDKERLEKKMNKEEMKRLWKKTYTEKDEEYNYFCPCGAEMSEDEYNSEMGTFTCTVCMSESPDLYNIKNEE